MDLFIVLLSFVAVVILYVLHYLFNFFWDKGEQWVKNAYHEYKNEKNGDTSESLANLHQPKQNSNEKNNF